jgi:hypothetical protein
MLFPFYSFLNNLSDVSEARKMIIRQRIVTRQQGQKIENEKISRE